MENLSTRMYEKEEKEKRIVMLKKHRCNLFKRRAQYEAQRNRAKEIIDLRSWPIFNLKPDYISRDEIIIAYCWDQRAIIVTEDKRVYSFGFASGINDTFSTCYSIKIEDLCGKNIKTFAKSSDFVLALTEEGEVYIWKEREQFSAKFIEIKFTQIVSLSKKGIVQVACSRNQFLALAKNGKVYAWGESNGQIDDGATFLCDDTEQQVKDELLNKNVTHIACGATFNVAITDEGKLYGWRNEASESVIAIGYEYDSPHEFTTISEIKKLACGDEHTLALTDEGKIYAWGNNDRGQIGVESNYKSDKFSSPTMVKMPEAVVDIAACHQSSVAVDIYGIIYVWGDFFGQHITTPFPTTFSKIHEAFVHISYHNVMHKPLTVSTFDYDIIKEEVNIVESLGAAFDDPSTSDFTVLVEGQPIYVHKAILKIRCQYFKNMFQRDSVEINQNAGSSAVYTVPDKYSYIVYKTFLKYIYIDTLDVSSDIAIELMKLADEYGEVSLKKKCTQRIKYEITASNVAFFYSKAIDYHSEELEEFCFQFALRHLKAVVLSEEFSKLNMNAKDKLILGAAEEDAFKTIIFAQRWSRSGVVHADNKYQASKVRMRGSIPIGCGRKSTHTRDVVEECRMASRMRDEVFCSRFESIVEKDREDMEKMD